MKFKIGDKVQLTDAGEEHFRYSKQFPKGTIAIIKSVLTHKYACEFDFVNQIWLHGCCGRCKPHQGRYLDEHEIELAYTFEPANIIELL